MAEGEFRVEGLCAGYGKIRVVYDVGLFVVSGETVAIVGRNGAGKTTTVRAAAGVRSGEFAGTVSLDGDDVTRLSPPELLARGVALVPEGHRVFGELTVSENLRVGGFATRSVGRAVFADRLGTVEALFPILGTFGNRPAGQLSGGQQQMLAIGQALMAGPRFLLLDEPSSGLAPAVVLDIYRALRELEDGGVGVIVVEQNVERGLQRSDRCYVLDGGRVMLEGKSEDLAAGADVAEIVSGVRRTASRKVAPESSQ